MSIERKVIEAYFESNGFLVRQAGESQPETGKKKFSPLPTIAVFNPTKSENTEKLSFRIFTGDLSNIRSALVSLLGWDNTTFSNDCLVVTLGYPSFSRMKRFQKDCRLVFNPAHSLQKVEWEIFCVY